MKQLIYMVSLSLLILTACSTRKPTTNTGQDSTGKIAEAPDSKNNTDNPIRDSVGYVKSIVSNKEKYVNKEFGVLIKDLDMQIKSYTSLHDNRVSSSGIIISFDNWTTTRDKTEGLRGAKDPVRLVIEWQNPISRADAEAQLKRAAGDWREVEQNYYSKLIVKDIKNL